MSRTVTFFLFALVALYIGLCVLLAVFQRSLIYFPQPAAFSTPENTMLMPVPGAELHVTVRPRPGQQALLYFGGNAEDVSANLPLLSRAFPDHALYLMHYRGYGSSTGKPTEAALHADAQALFDRVHAEHAQVLVIGRSLGSGVAVRLASVRPVTRLVLVTPFDSLVNVAARHYPYFPVRWLLQDRFESWRHASQVRAPSLLLVAENDRITPPEGARRLLSHFPDELATLKEIPDTDHNSISQSPAYVPALQGRE